MPASRYKIFLTAAFEKDLRRLDSIVRTRIEKRLIELLRDPEAGDRLAGITVGKRKVRVGDYRIRYDIKDEYIVLYRVRHRKEIYKK